MARGELDLGFLDDLTPQELALAQEAVRRNLKLKEVHIIEGASALRDVAAIPLLRTMLDQEPSESRRLTIAGALWKLNNDPVFLECLDRAKLAGGNLMVAHLHQVLWLNDERALDFLIDLLSSRDGDSWLWRAVRRARRIPLLGALVHGVWMSHAKAHREASAALSLLNHLEFGRRIPVMAADVPSQPSDYRRRQHDPAFREVMTSAVHKWNAETRNGR